MSGEAVLALAKELLVSESRLQEIEEEIEKGDVRGARIGLLGTLDARVEEGILPAHVSTEFYRRLGFTAEEMSGFRQYSAQRRFREGKDLPKKLS